MQAEREGFYKKFKLETFLHTSCMVSKLIRSSCCEVHERTIALNQFFRSVFRFQSFQEVIAKYQNREGWPTNFASNIKSFMTEAVIT